MQTKSQLIANYAQAVKDLQPTEDWREKRAALGKQFVKDLERLTRREGEEKSVLMTATSGKREEKVNGIRI